MRSTLVITALVLVATPVAGCRPYKGAPAGAAAVAGGEVVRDSGLGTRAVFKLPTGLTIVLEENHAAPVVALQAWVGVGSADDPPGQEGMAHLLQHALFLTTRNRPSGQIGRDVAAIGGRMGAWTGYDQTVFHALVASAFAETGIDLLAEALDQAALAPADVENARRAAREDLRQAAAAPDRVAAQAAFASAFPSHPFGRPIMGTDASVAAITAPQVRSFFERSYGAGNTTLVVVGDFDARVVRARVASAFGSWRPGMPGPRRAPPQEQTAPRVAVSTADVPVPQLVVAFRTPGARHRDAPALELLAALLGSGRGGRLETEVARNRQLATNVRAYLFNARDAGLLVTIAALGPGRVDEAARVVIDEMLRLARERIGPDELARARTIVDGDGASSKASLHGYARKLGLFTTLAGDPDFEATYLDRLRKVDVADLLDVAARTFRASHMTVAAVLPAARDPQRDDRAAKLITRLQVVAGASEARVAVPAAEAPVSASGREIVDYVLPSGVRLLVLRDDTASQVSVRAVWSGGVRLEDARLGGATSLLARLLPRGTRTRGIEQLNAELSEIAGTIDGIAGIDSLGMRGDFLAAHWERGIELLVDCLRNPKLADEEIERERRVLLDAIRARDDDPTELALRLFQGALFGRHPYRKDLLGTSDSVAGLTRRRLLDLYRRFYGSRGLTVAVLGNVEPSRVAAKVQSLFAGSVRPSDRETLQAPAQPPGTEPIEVFQTISKPEARIVLGYPGLTMRDPDRFALDVLAEVLGGPGGRLTKLRDQRGLVQSVGAVSWEGVDPGYLAATVSVRPEAIDAVVPMIRAEIALLVEGGVTDDEVARIKRKLVGTHALALERRGSVAHALALHGAFGGTGRSYRRDVDELAKVTSQDVLRAARRILDPRREVLAVVRPRDPPRQVAAIVDSRSGYTSR